MTDTGAHGAIVEAVIASQISDYGVVAFIAQPGQTGATFFLYKHP